MKKILIVAHRGEKGPHHENTLPAFRGAINNGARALEMDVRFDYFRKRFFLEHDFFHHPSARANLLTHVLNGIPEDAYLIIELKIARAFTSFFYVRHFVRFYKEHLKARPTLIQSFNPFALARLRRHLPDARVAFLGANPLWNFLFKRILFRAIRPQAFHLQKRVMNRRNVAFARKHRLDAMGFVLNAERHWKKAIRLGLDGIITDYPIECREFLKGQRQLTE